LIRRRSYYDCHDDYDAGDDGVEETILETNYIYLNPKNILLRTQSLLFCPVLSAE
jgi:hypothetical protein